MGRSEAAASVNVGSWEFPEGRRRNGRWSGSAELGASGPWPGWLDAKEG